MQQHAVQRPSILNVVLPELVGEFVRILVPGIKKSRKTNSLSLKHEYFYGVLRNTINVLSGSSSHRLPSTCEFSVKSQWVSGTQIAMLRPLVGRELRCRCESWRGKCKLQDVNSVYCFYLERADGTKMSIQMGYKVEKVDPKFGDLFLAVPILPEGSAKDFGLMKGYTAPPICAREFTSSFMLLGTSQWQVLPQNPIAQCNNKFWQKKWRQSGKILYSTDDYGFPTFVVVLDSDAEIKGANGCRKNFNTVVLPLFWDTESIYTPKYGGVVKDGYAVYGPKIVTGFDKVETSTASNKRSVEVNDENPRPSKKTRFSNPEFIYSTTQQSVAESEIYQQAEFAEREVEAKAFNEIQTKAADFTETEDPLQRLDGDLFFDNNFTHYLYDEPLFGGMDDFTTVF